MLYNIPVAHKMKIIKQDSNLHKNLIYHTKLTNLISSGQYQLLFHM